MRAGTHLDTERLKAIGISLRAARNTTLMDFAAQLPAAVLSALLGITIGAAAAWTNIAGSHGRYAAELASRR